MLSKIAPHSRLTCLFGNLIANSTPLNIEKKGKLFKYNKHHFNYFYRLISPVFNEQRAIPHKHCSS